MRFEFFFIDKELYIPTIIFLAIYLSCVALSTLVFLKLLKKLRYNILVKYKSESTNRTFLKMSRLGIVIQQIVFYIMSFLNFIYFIQIPKVTQDLDEPVYTYSRSYWLLYFVFLLFGLVSPIYKNMFNSHDSVNVDSDTTAYSNFYRRYNKSDGFIYDITTYFTYLYMFNVLFSLLYSVIYRI